MTLHFIVLLSVVCLPSISTQVVQYNGVYLVTRCNNTSDCSEFSGAVCAEGTTVDSHECKCSDINRKKCLTHMGYGMDCGLFNCFKEEKSLHYMDCRPVHNKIIELIHYYGLTTCQCRLGYEYVDEECVKRSLVNVTVGGYCDGNYNCMSKRCKYNRCLCGLNYDCDYEREYCEHSTSTCKCNSGLVYNAIWKRCEDSNQYGDYYGGSVNVDDGYDYNGSNDNGNYSTTTLWITIFGALFGLFCKCMCLAAIYKNRRRSTRTNVEPLTNVQSTLPQNTEHNSSTSNYDPPPTYQETIEQVWTTTTDGLTDTHGRPTEKNHAQNVY